MKKSVYFVTQKSKLFFPLLTLALSKKNSLEIMEVEEVEAEEEEGAEEEGEKFSSKKKRKEIFLFLRKGG
jgi:hypothetical protein